MKTTRKERLLSRMKAGLERFLARRRREEPAAPNRPKPTYDRVFEIMGDAARRSGGPAKGA
jgi:hypothetical protein